MIIIIIIMSYHNHECWHIQHILNTFKNHDFVFLRHKRPSDPLASHSRWTPEQSNQHPAVSGSLPHFFSPVKQFGLQRKKEPRSRLAQFISQSLHSLLRTSDLSRQVEQSCTVVTVYPSQWQTGRNTTKWRQQVTSHCPTAWVHSSTITTVRYFTLVNDRLWPLLQCHKTILVVIYRRFGTTYWVRLQDSPETSVNKTTLPA